MHCKEIKLQNIWRICNKIRAAIFRVGINLWEYYLPLDANKNCLISESQFVSVLSGPLRGPVGLSNEEISDLADYFRVQDGRIFYSQLCQVIHDSVPDFSENAPLVTGLEWQDPLQSNRLSLAEQRRLTLLITKIASFINIRRISLRPYFQDYELISKNNGTITIGHFARILSFLGILLSADDFNLLVKKYLIDSYTLNYIAFSQDCSSIVQFMKKRGVLDLGGDVLNQFPGRIINAELPKLPRPEIGKIMASSVFGKQNIFHPALNTPSEVQDLITVIRRIQRHVLENRLRIDEYFKLPSDEEDWRKVNHDFIPCETFLYAWELCMLAVTNSRFTIGILEIELEKFPCLCVEAPPREVEELSRKGARIWSKVNTSMQDLCEDAVRKVKEKVLRRRILLKPVFRDYDKHNNGHVSRSQMRQSLLSNGILLSDEELYALEERFNDDMGFNYYWFLTVAEPKPYEEPLYTGFLADMKRLNAPRPPRAILRKEKDIVLILAKIKGKVVRERIRVMEFLRDFDRCNEQVIKREDFRRGLAVCRFDLTENEIDTLCDVFASPMRSECIDFKRFSEVIEEAFTQSNLERAPQIMPLQHIPTKDCERNFLNFDERLTLSVAMQKLSKKPDLQMNLMSIFGDYDRTNCGTVSQELFLKALSIRGMYNLISRTEFDMICKCFSYERGLRDEVDYRAFIKALDILHATDKYNPF